MKATNEPLLVEKQATLRIEPPRMGDERAIGPMHVQAWKESYLNTEIGITEKVINELIGHVATDTDYRKNTLTEALAHPDKVLYRVVKNDKDKIVGFFHCTKTETFNELEGIYLLNEAKNSGIGSQLMNEFFAWADADKPFHLEAISYNDIALNFYKKFGFTEIDGSTQLYKDKVPFIEMTREAEKRNPPKRVSVIGG